MQDAFGGIMNLFFIAVFFVLIEGILGFTFSYTKAFKMKNIVLSSIEEYENACCVNPRNNRSPCREKITKQAELIGYSPASLKCPNGFQNIDDLFCVKKMTSKNDKTSYRIITQVDLNIILVRDIMPRKFFQVTGDTRPIYMKGRGCS